jgi:hypothetical protein
MKEEVLSALVSDVNQDEEVPKVSRLDDFEFAQAVKSKSSKAEVEYQLLDKSGTIKDSGLAGWDTLFLQFRDPTSGEHKSILRVRLPCSPLVPQLNHEIHPCLNRFRQASTGRSHTTLYRR